MSAAWSGKALKKKARQDIGKKYFRCVLVAAIVLLVVNVGGILRQAGKEKERGNVYIQNAQDQRDENFLFDLFLIHAKYHYSYIVMHKDFSYTPSEAGKALSDALEKCFPFKAEVMTIGDDSGFFKFWSSPAGKNPFHFPDYFILGPGRAVRFGYNLLIPCLKLIGLIFFCVIVIATKLAGWWFYLSVSKGESPGIEDMFSEFLILVENRLRGIWIIVTMVLKILIWSVLFIVPGFVKALECAMVPFIVASEGELSSKEVFQRSRELMQGQKKRVFLLWLSFAGYLLVYLMIATLGLVFSSVLTSVIWLIFCAVWLFPYWQLTFANLYLELTSEKEA